MHRALLVIALFKFLVALVAFTITSRIDPVLLVSCVLMAISSIIVRVVEEGEVAIVLVGLILLIDSIGVLLSLHKSLFSTCLHIFSSLCGTYKF